MAHKTVSLRNPYSLVLLCLTLIIYPLTAWSELVIRVTQGNDQPTVVAVSPMIMSGVQLAEDICKEVVCSKRFLAPIYSHFPLNLRMFILEIGGYWVVNI